MQMDSKYLLKSRLSLILHGSIEKRKSSEDFENCVRRFWLFSSPNTPFDKLIFNMRLLLQFPMVLATLLIENPFLNRAKDENRGFS